MQMIKKQGQKDQDFLSEDGVTYRKPKQLFSKEFEEMARQKTALIEEKKLDREKKFQRPIPQTSSSKWNAEETGKKESSVDQSSDSIKNKTSNIEQDSSKPFSDTDNSEKEKKKQKDKRDRKHHKKEDPERMVNIVLTETPTYQILHIPSVVVSTDDEELKDRVAAERKRYENLLKQNIGSDNFGEHSTQTMNFQMKNKKCETIILTENLEIKYAMSQAVPSEIEKDLASVQKKPHEVIADEIKNIIEKEFTDKLKNPFSLLPIDIKSIEMNAGEQRVVKKEAGRNVANRDTETMKNDSKKISAKITTTIQRGTTSQIKDKLTSEITESNKSGKQKQNIDNTIVQKTTEFGNSLEAENLHLIISEEEYRLLNSDTFNQNCKFALRIANQYKYHKNYIAYRNYPEQNLKGDERGEAKNLSGKMFGNKSKQTKEQEAEDNTLKDLNFLFKFECDTFRNRCVSSLDWNCVNTDLLAATYGEFDLKSDYKDGYLGFWTLKNPDFPERVIKTTSRAMNCRFSQRNPNLIGVGLYDGVVAIYDIRKKGDQPIADSKELDSKHLDAIWEVNWVGKSNANDKGEGLVSISSDGKIIEWSIKKGLESQELKVLNRVINPAIREEQPETINFRYTTGFSLNFVPGDNIIYFVSTEDGTVHKCSKSYREQYLSNYYGHTGPVYKVRCNPFWTDIFLTCSADWTCRVWNSKEDQAKLVLRDLTLSEEVLDIEWSPYCSTLFASTAKDGRLELWDLNKKPMDPIFIDWDDADNKRKRNPLKTYIRGPA